MARTKSDIGKNIRKTITGSSSMDYKGEVGKNIELSKTLHGVSTFIETLSRNEQDLFKKLIAAVEEIPKNNDELQRQQKNIFDNLIKTTALMKRAAETEKDPKKKQELESAASSMMERGTSVQKNLDTNPRGLREMIGAKKYGIDPREVREKGLVRSVFSQAKREVFGGNYEPKFSEVVEKQQQVLPTAESTDSAPSSSAIEIPKKEKPLKEKTKDNLASLNATNAVLKSILSEVKDIKKNLGKKSDKPSDKSSGKPSDKPSIKLSKKEKEAQKWRDVEKFSLRDYYDRKQKEKTPNKLLDVSKIDENPNKLRDVSKIDQNPFDEVRYTGSDIDKDTEQKPVQGSMEQPSKSDGGSLLPIAAGLGGGMLSNMFKSGLGKLFKKGAVPASEKAAVKAGEKGAVKAGEKAAVKAGEKVGGKALAKAGAKAGAKAIGKSVLKKLPLIGLAAGIGFGIQRAMKGDYTGAAGEVLSGAASTIPGVGTAASVAIDAGLAAKDIKEATDVEGTTEAAAMGNISGQLAPAAAKVEATKKQTIASVENSSRSQMNTPTASAPIINNITNASPAQAVKSTPNNPVLPPVRTSDNSFLRYQDRRMTRVL